MRTWKWLHGQMNALMSLEIMIPIEALRTLVAFERTVMRRTARSHPRANRM